MIICKIITNFNNNSGDFGKLMEELGEIGSTFWSSGNLFFGSNNVKIKESKVSRILKKCGYDKFFIDIYDSNNQPQETEVINGWIYDFLIQQEKIKIEQENQESLQAMSKQIEQAAKAVVDEIAKLQKS